MERFSTFDDPSVFRALVEPRLVAHEAENNLIFGILNAIDRGVYARYTLGLLERDGEIASVVVQTPPFPMVLGYGAPEDARALARLVPGAVDAIHGESSQAKAFADAWVSRTGGTSTVHMRQRIYRLQAVKAPPSVAGYARVAGPEDRDLLSRWLHAFEVEALPPDTPRALSLEDQVSLRIANGSVLLWQDGHDVVCMAGFGGPTPNGIRVGPVYTPPEHRRRGYAAACVAELSRRELSEGRSFCFLFTDLANPTSNGVYRRIGYEPVCDVDIYRLKTDETGARPRKIKVGEARRQIEA